MFSTFFYPNTINQTDPMYITIYVFVGVVEGMPLGFQCTKLMTVVSFANPTLLYVLTAYSTL